MIDEQNKELFVWRIDADGKFIWNPNGVRVTFDEDIDDIEAKLVPDGYGGCFVAYHEQADDPSYVWARYITPEGEQAWSEPVVIASCSTCVRMLVDLFEGGPGCAIAVFLGTGDMWYGVPYFSRKIDTEGQFPWGPSETDGMIGSFRWDFNTGYPVFKPDGEGGRIGIGFTGECVWDYYDQVWICEPHYINAQKYTPENLENTGWNTTFYQEIVLNWARNLNIVPDSLGGAIATWHEKRCPNCNYDIYAQRFDAEGEPLWGPEGKGVVIGAEDPEIYFSNLIPSEPGSAILLYYIDNVGGFAKRIFPDGSLPVTLSYFYATPLEDSILLEWATESEQDNLGWNIYRSNNSRTGFTKINDQLIPGAGNTSTPTNYSYEDFDVKSGYTYTYYLESIDYSGVTYHYKTVSVSIE